VLFEDPRITHITGIDIKPSTLQHHKYSEFIADIRNNNLAQYYQDVDALIHMAFVVNSAELGEQRRDREYIRSVNIQGSHNVFQLAIQHHVKHLLHFSSAVVYGLSDGNPTFISETQPLHVMQGFYYSEDKVAIEQWLDEFEQQHPGMRIVRLRPHVILGQYTQPLIKDLLQQRFYFNFPDPQPLTQCISEMDVASAMLQALFSEAHGSFNLATDQVASMHLIQQHLHSFSFPVPFSLAKRMHEYAWRFTGRYGDPGWIQCLRYPLTLDNEKAKRELHWKPTLDLFECLDAAI